MLTRIAREYALAVRGVADDPQKRGWYFFGPPPIDEIKDLVETHYVQPKVGTLFLFPPYYWHRTVPFDSEDERVTVAFDAVPLSS